MFKGITRWKNYIFVISGMCNIVENVKITHFKKYLHVHCHHSSGYLSIKKNPITMKIDTPEFHSVFTPELNSLAKLFEKYGYELRIVGGAVRDLLSGQSPHDLDFATTATPDQMKEMFEKEGVRMLNTKGEKHGTITPRINDKANFEVTTLRTDVKTDGRHAEVEFTKSWELDAMRRDLTVNSMYLGFDGKVYDYFGGYEDLRNRRVIFVGNASQRIQEDYLRILRYFRFYGRIAKNAHSHDEETLKAIQENASGLQKISGERIWSELQRIVTGNFAEELVKKMLDLGLSTHIGLGPVEDLDIKSFENTYRLKEKYAFRSITYIAALLPNEERVLQFHSRVKLSAHERDLAIFINNFKSDNLAEPIENPLRPFQFLLITTKMKRQQIREFILELFRFKDREDLLTTFESWKIPSFPVNGEKLKEKGMSRGNDIGFALNQMKVFWAESDFTLSENELMEKLPEILAQIQNRTGKK